MFLFLKKELKKLKLPFYQVNPPVPARPRKHVFAASLLPRIYDDEKKVLFGKRYLPFELTLSLRLIPFHLSFLSSAALATGQEE